ncbi:MAG: hypothetical protein HYT34_00585 [Candidatus Ryanbacteria bacterium]|nr:hypothetical protein [Candidatus Ryanbacteria bacterium]
MTRRKRIFLFWICTVIFVIITAPLVLYSFGYRLSLDPIGIVRSGGLFITSTPSTGTDIYVDGKLAEHTSLFSRKFFIQGLTPRKYKIEIRKDGYFTWEKTLRVEPEHITEVKALLIKDGPDGTILSRGGFASLMLTNSDETHLTLRDSKNRTRFYEIESASFTPRPTLLGASTTLSDLAKDFVLKRKIKNFDYDASQERIIWWDDYEVKIKWLRGEEFMPLYTDSDEILIFRSQGPLREVALYPGKEAIFASWSNAVSVIELDGRDEHNIYPLYKGREPHFTIAPKRKMAYLLDDGNLISIPLL